MKSAVNSGFSTPCAPEFEELVYIVEIELPLPNPSTLYTGLPHPEENGHIYSLAVYYLAWNSQALAQGP